MQSVFKRSLAEFAVLGILYFAKRLPLLMEQQRAQNPNVCCRLAARPYPFSGWLR